MTFVRSILGFYIDVAPLTVLFTTTCGAMISINNETNTNEKHSPQEMFINIIGLTSTGLLTGLLFPISFPLLSAYVMKKQIKLIAKTSE